MIISSCMLLQVALFHSFFFMANIPLYICNSFFIHSSVSGHQGCFRVLAVVNSAAVNTGIHVSFSVLFSSGYMPKSRIAGSYGGFILAF